MLTKIAIIEDDPMIAQLLCTWLAPYRYVCECFHSGEAFLAYDWQSAGFELLLVDWQLPGITGVELIKQIIPSNQPPAIICVTAFSRAEDLAHALHAGADDFVSKPVNKSVLLARMRAVLRRRGLALPLPQIDTGLTLKPASLEVVSRAGTKCRLSPAQFRALDCLMRSPGEVVCRAVLIEAIWSKVESREHSRALDLLISRLRQKLLQLDSTAFNITSHYGVGYSYSLGADDPQM